MADALDQLVEKLRQALPEDLISVVLYGSAVVGDHDEKFSDYNVLCVLNRLTPAQLGATESVFRWWRGQGNPSPLLLTKHEVETSTDCFAIEFHDIKEHHRILHGADLVSSLTIDRCFYRSQVEHDLRAKLLRHTTTLGLRETTVARYSLEREIKTVETPYGSVRIKIAKLPDGSLKAAPEHDDCAARAIEHDVPVSEVWLAAIQTLKNS